MAFWINTNEDNFPGAYLDMIRHGKASLHGGDARFRGQINTQMMGSLIFYITIKLALLLLG
jgi:hypothetical protein